MSSLRDAFNVSSPNNVPDALRKVGAGEVLSILIAAMTPTEAGVVPAANVATLAASASVVLQVNATAGTVTGVKKLIPAGQVPVTGEASWNGDKLITFAAADAVTAVSVTYGKTDGTQKASVLMADFAG